jgi:hypothetical protein
LVAILAQMAAAITFFAEHAGVHQQPLTVQPPDAALAKHFASKELRRLHPWRAESEAARDKWSMQAAKEVETIQAVFLAQCEAFQVVPEDMILIYYLLYATEEEKRAYAWAVMHEGPMERLRAHNWAVAEKGEATKAKFLTTNGAAIAKLTLPLFPTIPEFGTLNTLVLRSVDGVSGGSFAETRCAAFKQAPSTKSGVQAKGKELVGGEFYVPVLKNADGVSYVELTVVEETVSLLQRQVAELHSDVQQLKRRQPRQPARRDNGPTTPSNNNNYGAYANNNQSYPNYQNSNRGRGQGNSQPPRYPRGGEDGGSPNPAPAYNAQAYNAQPTPSGFPRLL